MNNEMIKLFSAANLLPYWDTRRLGCTYDTIDKIDKMRIGRFGNDPCGWVSYVDRETKHLLPSRDALWRQVYDMRENDLKNLVHQLEKGESRTLVLRGLDEIGAEDISCWKGICAAANPGSDIKLYSAYRLIAFTLREFQRGWNVDETQVTCIGDISMYVRDCALGLDEDQREFFLWGVCDILEQQTALSHDLVSSLFSTVRDGIVQTGCQLLDRANVGRWTTMRITMLLRIAMTLDRKDIIGIFETQLEKWLREPEMIHIIATPRHVQGWLLFATCDYLIGKEGNPGLAIDAVIAQVSQTIQDPLIKDRSILAQRCAWLLCALSVGQHDSDASTDSLAWAMAALFAELGEDLPAHRPLPLASLLLSRCVSMCAPLTNAGPLHTLFAGTNGRGHSRDFLRVLRAVRPSHPLLELAEARSRDWEDLEASVKLTAPLEPK